MRGGVKKSEILPCDNTYRPISKQIGSDSFVLGGISDDEYRGLRVWDDRFLLLVVLGQNM